MVPRARWSWASARGWALCVMLTAGLTGCAIPDWFDKDEDPPLKGKRISILALKDSVRADPETADIPVRVPPPYANPDWSQAGGSSAHAMYHLSLGSPLTQLWQADVGEGSDDDKQLLAQPLVVGDRVFTMDSQSLVTAFDRNSGGQVWRASLDPEDEDDGFFGGGIAFDDGRVLVTTGFARVFALDAGSGEVLWEQSVPAPIRAAPTASGGRVFVVTIDSQLFALAADTGRRLWDHAGIQESAGLLGNASPAVSGSTVVVPYTSGEIFALLVENGRVLWGDSLQSIRRSDPVADMAHIRGLPVIDRGIVLAISHAGQMVAIDLNRGVRAWDANLGGIEMPWVAGDFIYLMTNEHQVVCVTRRDGRVRWVQQLPLYEDPEELEGPVRWVGPVLAGDRLIVAGSNRQALALSPYTGEILSGIDLPGGPAVAPVVAGGTIYFLTEDSILVAMR